MTTPARPIASTNDYDTALISQARAIAAAKTADQMRAYLATRNAYDTDADYDTMRAAFLGYAQGVLAEIATMAERLTPRPAPVQLAMFAPDDEFGTPDMFAHSDDFVVLTIDETDDEAPRFACCEHCRDAETDVDDHPSPCPQGCTPAPIEYAADGR
jgi:hypothetical protein